MCEIMEELVKEGEARGLERGLEQGKEQEKETRVARAISLRKLSLSEIADMFEIPLAKVSEIGRLHSLL